MVDQCLSNCLSPPPHPFPAPALPYAKPWLVTVCASLFVFDYFCTLTEEIAYVWTQPWSLGSVLFFLNRYLPFIDIGFILHITFNIMDPVSCRIYHLIFIWFLTSGIFISEVILMLRTYAMWNRQRFVLIIISIVGLLNFTCLVITLGFSIDTLRFGPTQSLRFGCRVSRPNKFAPIYYTMVCVSETVIVTLTMIKAFEHRHARVYWVFRLYRDGLLFYFYVLAITLANIVITFTAKTPDRKNLLPLMQRIFHSIFCSKVILLILSQRDKTSAAGDDGETEMSGVFTSVFEMTELESETDSDGRTRRDWTE